MSPCTQKAKTLSELAEERETELLERADAREKEARRTSQAALSRSELDRPTVRVEPIPRGGNSTRGDQDDEGLGPLSLSFFWSCTLSMLHFTLDVLVHHQYRQEIGWGMIVRRTATSFPVVWLLVYMLHPPERADLPLTQMLFFGLSVAAGCWLIRAANLDGYYAVMKQAPPLGTLWVWSVVELRLPWAVASTVAVVAFLYAGGYSLV